MRPFSLGVVVSELALLSLPKNRPREGAEADKPGSYEQALVLYGAVISPGETIRIEQFVTGYGEIRLAKLVFYPAREIFDHERSFVSLGIKESGKSLVFGRQRELVKEDGFAVSLLGLRIESSDQWTDSTLIVDAGTNFPADVQPQIATEMRLEKAPFEYELVTRDDVKPGKYALEFHFTYFNGSAWKTSSKKVEFQVQNWFERNEGLVKTVGLFLAVAGIGKILWGMAASFVSLFF